MSFIFKGIVFLLSRDWIELTMEARSRWITSMGNFLIASPFNKMKFSVLFITVKQSSARLGTDIAVPRQSTTSDYLLISFLFLLEQSSPRRAKKRDRCSLNISHSTYSSTTKKTKNLITTPIWYFETIRKARNANDLNIFRNLEIGASPKFFDWHRSLLFLIQVKRLKAHTVYNNSCELISE